MSTIIHPSLNVQRIEHKSLRRTIEIYQNVFCRSLSNINQLMLFYYIFPSIFLSFSFCLLWLYATFYFTNKYPKKLTHEQIKPTVFLRIYFLFELHGVRGIFKLVLQINVLWFLLCLLHMEYVL